MRIRITHTGGEEAEEFDLPEDGPKLLAHLIGSIPEMQESRAIGPDLFAGRLEAAMTGSTWGYVGPAIEIRRIPDSCSETDPDKMCPDCREGFESRKAGSELEAWVKEHGNERRSL